MPRKRLTREESRDQTRERLLEAGAAVIAKKGLAGSSVEDIAAHAGYTRGAFYSNFGSKNDLFIDLLKRDHADIQESMQQILDAGLSKKDLQTRLAEFYVQAYCGETSFALWAEARVCSLRDPKFRARLNALMLEKRDTIGHFIELFCKAMDKQLNVPGRDLAFGMMALVDGVRFFNVCMPKELPEENAKDVLHTVFAALFFD
ncbi:TetR/AcrR family transcriptional regulator [Dyella sp.]|uniref:TetR/AcrR family transcriptional regulator n=1 Tax=Dyella sp. TaxID=1869338 RepID=UPI002ED64AE5